MKKQLQKLILIAVLIGAIHYVSSAQTVSDFENLTLNANTYWDGSDTPLGTNFTSGNAIFPNNYDTSYGGYWATGWAYSNMKDTVTSGFFNMFSAVTGGAYNNSSNFIVGTQGSLVNLNATAIGKVVYGFYVTNGTYAALSMKDGDFSGKKFGGTTGNDPDWFKLTVHAYANGTLINDSVEFYLADYRFSDNQLDYIVKTWEWVDLSSLGNVDSLMFSLSSSDNGTYGMNTPAFFCVDNFTTADSPSALAENSKPNAIHFFPNPASNFLNIVLSNSGMEIPIEIYNAVGQKVYEQNIYENTSVNVSAWPCGVYFVRTIQDEIPQNFKFIKD